MKYNKVEIGKLVNLCQGFAINKKSKHHISEEQTKLKVLRIGDMKENRFSVYAKDTIPEKFIAREKDIIYTRTGQVGLVFRKQYGVVHNNCFTVSTKDEEILYQEYIYYALQEKSFYEEAITRATGAAQPDLTHGSFNSIQIYLPSIDKQMRITQILDVYNNLIENNRKQIKLLEEAAQRLYKEWFVDFRFPGYEKMKFIGGIPEGWYEVLLEEISTFKRGKTITKAQVKAGVVPVVAGGLEPAYYHNQANTKSPVITISASGANAGFSRLYNVPVFASDCSFIDNDSTPYLFYVYCFLQDNKAKLRSLQKGAAQPHVYAKDINMLTIMKPAENILEGFCRIISSYFEKIKIIEFEIKLLKEARDRLLPKLLSGEIEV